MGRPKTIALWVVSSLAAALFCMAGIPKIGGAATEQFAGWGYPAWFATVIGLGEVSGGVSLLIPRVARYGALLLAAIMVGATFTHVRAGEWNRVLFTVVLGALLLLVFRWRSSTGRRSPDGT